MSLLRLGLVAVLLALGWSTSVLALDPADIIVYGAHTDLGVTRHNLPFLNPFDDPKEEADDPQTRIVLQAAPGLRQPKGTSPWGHTTWGKYVLIGNYDEHGGGITPQIEDQRVGVFDTETGHFCEIDVNPASNANASVQFLVVASPQARQTKIFWDGFDLVGAGFPFGWIEADMDKDPCVPYSPGPPSVGWKVIGKTAGDLNAAATAGGLPPEKMPCGAVQCGFDGIAVLDPERVVLNSWLPTPAPNRPRVDVVRVDAGGTLSVPDVYPMPNWQPSGTNGTCYTLRPVHLPAVDPTHLASNDRRFTSSFDVTCDTPDDAVTAGDDCAPSYGTCPNGSLCSTSSPCSGYYCERPFFGSYISCVPGSSTCSNVFGADLGACTNCPGPAVHPGFVCSNNTSQHCSPSLSGQCPSGGSCLCTWPGNPAQEFRFDGTTPSSTKITPMSPFFRMNTEGVITLGTYDDYGGLWLDATVNGVVRVPMIYGWDPYAQKHSYEDPSNPTGTVVAFTPGLDRVFDTCPNCFEGTNFFAGPFRARQYGNTVYLGGLRSLQRVIQGYGTWTFDTAAKRSLGAEQLPAESGTCSGSGAFCNAANSCPTGQTCRRFFCTCTSTFGCQSTNTSCDANPTSCPMEINNPSKQEVCSENVGIWIKPDLAIGGAPPSVWMVSGFYDAQARPKNVYLVRQPLATWLTDNISTVRPSEVWSGDRLWVVAEHSGALKYRVRDDGFWSDWGSLPGIGVAGGAAIIASGTTVRAFAVNASGQVVTSQLLSALSCAVGSCSWSSWDPLPSGPTVVGDVAATASTGSGWAVAIRSTDQKVYVLRYNGSSYSSWFRAGNAAFTSDASPAITYHAGDNRLWVAARESSTGQIKFSRVNMSGTNGTTWATVGSGGGVTSWGVAPAIISDGTNVRAYSAQPVFPQWVYQTISSDGSWGNWRQLSSNGQSTLQPTAANVNGTINVLSYWYVLGMQEQAME